jgi:DNA processing protein
VSLADSFGVGVADAGWSTVSGLARGIDAAAHRGCLRRGGHAVAVLGSGVDVCYPKENRPLFDGIIEGGGAIISEYPPGTPPDRWRFPARNMIIAAMRWCGGRGREKGGASSPLSCRRSGGRADVPGDVDRDVSGLQPTHWDGAHPSWVSTI